MGFDLSGASAEGVSRRDDERLDLRVCWPLLSVHAGCFLVLLTGVSPVALGVFLLFFWLRSFGITAGYHRLLSHRSFETSRTFRFVLAWLGASAAQLGPIWWVGHHRAHHLHSDTAQDVHSPVRGLWWAHMGWLLCRRNVEPQLELVPDLVAAPELRFLDRNPWLPPLVLVGLLYALGSALGRWAPGLGTSGLQLVVWGFFVGTVLIYHLTFVVNSLGHRLGGQRFPGRDQSRNNRLLALITFGDGWHNNHHRHPAAARHGMGPAEPDPTHAAIRGLERLGLVWNLRPMPLPSTDQPLLVEVR